MGRSRRSTPRTGKPATGGRTAACRARSRLQRDGDTLVNTGVVAWPDEDSAWVTVRRMQPKVHRWASGDSAHRFGDLFNLVYDPAFLIHAWERVRGNDGARTAGIDGHTVAQIETRVGVHAFLGQVRDLLKSGEYRPSPVRRVKIPKGRREATQLGDPHRGRPGGPGRLQGGAGTGLRGGLPTVLVRVSPEPARPGRDRRDSPLHLPAGQLSLCVGGRHRRVFRRD